MNNEGVYIHPFLFISFLTNVNQRTVQYTMFKWEAEIIEHIRELILMLYYPFYALLSNHHYTETMNVSFTYLNTTHLEKLLPPFSTFQIV